MTHFVYTSTLWSSQILSYLSKHRYYFCSTIHMKTYFTSIFFFLLLFSIKFYMHLICFFASNIKMKKIRFAWQFQVVNKTHTQTLYWRRQKKHPNMLFSHTYRKCNRVKSTAIVCLCLCDKQHSLLLVCGNVVNSWHFEILFLVSYANKSFH